MRRWSVVLPFFSLVRSYPLSGSGRKLMGLFLQRLSLIKGFDDSRFGNLIEV